MNQKKHSDNFHKMMLLRLVLFFILLLWCLGFSINFLFPKSEELLVFSPVIKKIYSTVCYQDELRTLSFYGKKLFVCTRCTGIYLGALLFSFISIFFGQIKSSGNLFLAGMSTIFADIIIYSTGIFNYSKYYAFVTGFFFGSAAFLYILIILENEFFAKE
jgi:uncharacterized membrane protein